jgi:hypothetical protein
MCACVCHRSAEEQSSCSKSIAFLKHNFFVVVGGFCLTVLLIAYVMIVDLVRAGYVCMCTCVYMCVYISGIFCWTTKASSFAGVFNCTRPCMRKCVVCCVLRVVYARVFDCRVNDTSVSTLSRVLRHSLSLIDAHVAGLRVRAGCLSLRLASSSRKYIL